MIKVFKKTVKDQKVITSLNLVNEKGIFIYCINPSADEIKTLSLKLGINDGLIKDALDPYEVPRLEEDNDIIFTITSFPVKDGGRLLSIPFAIAVNGDFAAIISSRNLHFLENWFESGTDFVTTQKTKLVNMIFKNLMEEYNRQLTAINREVHRISLTPGKIVRDDIAKLVWFEESLNLLFGDLTPTHSILRKILSGKKLKLYDEDKEIIEDTILYTEQLLELVKQNLMKISNLRNVYSTILTDNLNNTIKFLTAATVILTVPTIIASIYGMNVPLPLENHPSAFVLVILLILFSTIFLIYFFIKNKWF